MGKKGFDMSTSQSKTDVVIVEGELFTVDDAARLCCVSAEWVLSRIEAQVIEATTADGGRVRLSSQTVWRARRIADIERQFDADPHLAALVADLIDEVRGLREQMALLQGGR